MNYVILSEKLWNQQLVPHLRKKYPDDKWIYINHRNVFSKDELAVINPDKIFIPHWSYIIPENIFNKYECIVFHMTDLPFGRGGSPLQNLISRGYKDTKISALKVVREIDAGPIYCKQDLSLLGSAEEIFIRANKVIEQMIIKIIHSDITPVDQEGEPVTFTRRKPEESDLKDISDIESIFDYIRMLDADGYPKAYLEVDKIRYEFSHAALKADGSIIADVRILNKE